MPRAKDVSRSFMVKMGECGCCALVWEKGRGGGGEACWWGGQYWKAFCQRCPTHADLVLAALRPPIEAEGRQVLVGVLPGTR